MFDLPRLPVAEKVNEITLYLRTEFRSFFRAISDNLEMLVESIQDVLLYSEPGVFVALVLLALVAGGWRLGLFTGLGFTLVSNLGLWTATMYTLALVLAAGVVCFTIGLPLGVAMTRFRIVDKVTRPVLDLMQTMPAFVYLVPALSFFKVGVVAGLFATSVFALPPMVRLVAHGINQVDREFVEAAEAFGATPWQTLVKVQIPLARESIMVGVNQMLMMALSMVVIAAMVAAPGLGGVVLTGITTMDAGVAFEGGICIVILAVVLDRITQGFGARGKAGERKPLFAGLGASLARTGRALAGTWGNKDPAAAPKPRAPTAAPKARSLGPVPGNRPPAPTKDRP